LISSTKDLILTERLDDVMKDLFEGDFNKFERLLFFYKERLDDLMT